MRRPRFNYRVVFCVLLILCICAFLIYINESSYKYATDLIENSQVNSLDRLLRSAKILPQVSSMHAYYAVNCTAVFAGDEKELSKIETLLKDPGKVQIPSDAQVAENWLTDCGAYRRDRNYPKRASSEEEAEFPIAYSIVVHKDAAQVGRLLRSIYQPQNVYCIHTDVKSDPYFKTAIGRLAQCFSNVFIASKFEDVQWGGISQVLAHLHCMEDLLRYPVSWKYFINLCGQDFPLKTNVEIVQQLKAYNGHNYIPGKDAGKGKSFEYRYKYKHGKEYDGKRVEKDPPPFNIHMYKGSTYIAATWKFVDFLVNSKVSTTFLAWLNDTLCPDEMFTNSLHRVLGAPGGYPYELPNLDDGNVKYVKWADQPTFPKCHGKYQRSVCVFRSNDLQYLWRRPEMFVNKFIYDYDPVTMQCMEELLEFRQQHPGILQKATYFPVSNYSWQQYTNESYVPGL